MKPIVVIRISPASAELPGDVVYSCGQEELA